MFAPVPSRSQPCHRRTRMVGESMLPPVGPEPKKRAMRRIQAGRARIRSGEALMDTRARPAPPRSPLQDPVAPPTAAAAPERGAEPQASEGDFQDYRLADMRRAELSMVLVRWAAIAFAVAQVLAYRTEPYPPGIEAAALGLAGVLAVANLGIWLASRRTGDLRGARRLAVVALATDILLASAFVWLYAFDPISALWAILFILPLEGAIRFGLPGALASWTAVTTLYIGREIYADAVYGDPFQPESG